MEQRINIAELLKDCPKGMELDCVMYEDCKFLDIDSTNDSYLIRITTPCGIKYLDKYGCYTIDNKAKCVIFPKGKTTWEGFVPPCKFKDGDVLFIDCSDDEDKLYQYIFILNDPKFHGKWHSYCYLDGVGCFHSEKAYLTYDVKEIRLATEEEKQKLFDAIKDKGFQWNAETKTLEKLEQTWTIQDAKDGDVLAFDDETIVIFKDLYNNTSFHSYCHIEDGIFTISKEDMPDWWRAKGFYPATEEQCTLLFRKIKEAGYHWNAETKTLEKLVEPKFKVVVVGEQCIPYEANEHLRETTMIVMTSIKIGKI